MIIWWYLFLIFWGDDMDTTVPGRFFAPPKTVRFNGALMMCDTFCECTKCFYFYRFVFCVWSWVTDQGYSDTEARKRLSCYWGKNAVQASKHGESNIKQVLKLLVWVFCKRKGCRKMKFNDPLVVEAIEKNMLLKAFLTKLGDKKVKTVSSINKVGAGVLPQQVYFVSSLQLCWKCFFLSERCWMV